MTRTLRYLFVLLFVGVSATAFGQAGDISGRILDEKKEPVLNAVVQAFEGGILKGTGVSDFDGYYTIKPLSPSRYDVVVRALGLLNDTTTGVIVSPDKTTGHNVTMQVKSNVIKQVVIKQYKVKLVDEYSTGGNNTLGSEAIQHAAVITTDQLVALSPGVYQQSRKSDGVNIGGARTEGTLYIIDGVAVRTNFGTNLSQESIDQIEVLTSGISAKYGDVSGGVVNITTKGGSKEFQGEIRGQHSVDGYNNNLINFQISGPLYKKLIKEKDTQYKKPVLGFSLGGDFYYDNDRNPSYNNTYVAKGDVLKNLTQNPLTIKSDAGGNQIYTYSSEYITKSQLNSVKLPVNDKTIEGRLNGKINYQLNDNISIDAGANFDYTKADLFSNGSVIFAPSSIPTEQTYVGRGFVRLTQKFAKKSSDKPEGETGLPKTGTISNAYYTLQADYQKTYIIREDPTYKSNIFNYGYIGKFNQSYKNSYQLGVDTATGRAGVVLQSTQNPSAITYTRSNMNSSLANYTTQYFNTVSVAPTSLSQVQNAHGLLNGDLPINTYELDNNVGSGLYYYYKRNYDQYSVSIDASFDLQLGKTKHAIQFGLSYQQRIERLYTSYSNLNGEGTSSIWQLMRQLTNTQLTLDKSNPVFVINGQKYTKTQVQNGTVKPSPYDTILYNTVSSGAKSTFDKNLRKKLGLDTGSTNYLNVDAYDPSMYSLNMFSADELLNNGNRYVNYYGYTYTGGTQAGNVTFNDFWTAKDANGVKTRPVAAYQPNYIAGYILDRFQFKHDFNFNIGFRIDRFDNNTSVLKDPYSLVAEQKVSDLSNSPGHNAVNNVNGRITPSNITGDYVVYVDNNPTDASSPNIVGYRNGSNWYDPTGKYVENPDVLKNYTNGRPIQPYLVRDASGQVSKITDATYNPSTAFTSYVPQVTIMPRIQFSFPISDKVLFFAHYDIYAQRPNTSGASNIAYATPVTYYYLNQTASSIISNPNLKPQLTYDYEIGFTQQISQQSAVTLSAFYKERKNQIAIRPFIDAYPTTYYTYYNADFSTNKGVSMKYELRRINRVTMSLAYTLNFAEGTGSSTTSGNGGQSGQISPNGLLQNFIEAGLPNLRYVQALNFDSRHIIAWNADYRFENGDGPMIGGRHIFENVGLNMIATARSGEPYTKYSVPDVVTHAVVGGVNGSRLPWHYNVDLRLDKSFMLSHTKKHADGENGIKPKKSIGLNVFLYAQNVFNIRDILGVYGYTGRPDDNGYLTSSYGIAKLPSVTSPASYKDLYQIAYNSPGSYNLPRTVTLGIQINF